jgi:hypothetical protein
MLVRGRFANVVHPHHSQFGVRTVRSDDDHVVDPGSSHMQIQTSPKPTSDLTLVSLMQILVLSTVWTQLQMS